MTIDLEMQQITSLFPDDMVVPTFGSTGQVPVAEAHRQESGDTVGEASTAIARKASRVTRSSAAKALGHDEFLLMKTQQAQERLSKRSTVMLQMVIPEWDDDRRGLPNSVARSGIFTAASVNSPRADIKDEVIASLNNYVVQYSGIELRQDDLSVWLAIVSMGRNQPIDEPIQFTAYSLIKDLGWHVHSDTYKSVKDIIRRLKYTAVTIRTVDHKSEYAGSFVRDYRFDDTDAKGKTCWTVRLEDSISSLFLEDTTTLVEWQILCKLSRRATLARWLCSFYSTHSKPYPYHISKLHELSKSECKELSNFRTNVRAALEKLVEKGFLSSYTLRDDIVSVQRSRRFEELKSAMN